MVASTNSNGIGRPLMQTDDSPILQNQIHSRRFSNNFQSYANDSHVIKENFECNQCGKQFGNQQILQLHTRLHESQSLLRGVPGAAATLTQCNGTLSFNFNITIDFSQDDQEGTFLRERLTNILSSNTLWENVTQSIANLKGQSGVEKERKTDNNSPEISLCQTPDQDTFSSGSECTISTTSKPKQHNVNDSASSDNPSKLDEEISKKDEASQSTPMRTQPVTRGRKAVGLTKIRMEDCRRCDACSCIYMDERDYIKHMKNFHKHDVRDLQLGEKEDLNFRPFRHKQEKRQRHSPTSPQKKCRSCCKQCKCKGSHDTLQPMLPILRPVLGRQPTRMQSAAEGELPSDIKDRWNRVVTQRLTDNVTGVAEPDSDISHLLSQVEVKIKTEPTEESPAIVLEDTDYFPQVKQEILDEHMLEY